MKKALLICLSLVLALGGWNAVSAEDGFYVIPAMKGNYAPVPKTGQTTSYFSLNFDDGALEKGVPWPAMRFTDNGNGTVTDNLTGLIWLKNANILPLRTWELAMEECFLLKSGKAGLTDGSKWGDWRLPNVRELLSLIDYGRSFPALPEGHPFSLDPAPYWTSTTVHGTGFDTNAWTVGFSNGTVGSSLKTGATCRVWPVRSRK